MSGKKQIIHIIKFTCYLLVSITLQIIKVIENGRGNQEWTIQRNYK
jgi:hypothetical protein